MSDNEITFYKFYSGIRYFLSELLKKPIEVKLPSFLVEKGMDKDIIINYFIKNGIIERHEKILDRTNSDETEAKYVVRYKVKKEGFEEKMMIMYKKFFKNNVNENKTFFKNEEEMKENILNSPDGDRYRKCGGMKMPLVSRDIYNPKGLKENKMKSIFITEEQFRYLQENIGCVNAGDALLKEDGEANLSADAGGIQGSGDTIKTKPKSVGPFSDKGDGFFDGTKSSSAPVMVK